MIQMNVFLFIDENDKSFIDIVCIVIRFDNDQMMDTFIIYIINYFT